MAANHKPGFCRPPKEHQFKKGTSGNPRGRPRKQKPDPSTNSDAEILTKLYDETVLVDGKEMSKRELELRVLQKKALSGDVPAMKLLDERSKKAGVAGGKPRRVGVLCVPPPVSAEEWAKEAEKNQAQYRENRHNDGGHN